MAVVRARSSPPYGLFAAVAFAVLATGAAVFFYLMWNKSLAEHDAFQTKAANLGGADPTALLTKVGVTTYDAKNPAIAQLATALGKVTDELNTARARLAVNADDIAGKERNIANIRQMADDAAASVRQYQKRIEDIQSAFNTQSATATETIKKLNDAIASSNFQRGDAEVKAQEALNKFMRDAEDQRRELVLRLEDSQSQIAKLTAEIRDLRLRILNFGGKTDVSIGEPDGRVVRVNGATGEVYINLGKKDRMAPGLPFTAYDPRTGVRFGTDESAQGNGSIEVIQVGEEMSLCRVTRTSKDRAIQADDLIANIVYHNDRTRKFHFTVFGEFDLDGDGVATAAERERLIVLIKSWGGQVDDDVTSQTDYLVLGAKPKPPLLDQSEPEPAATSTAPAAEGAPAPASAPAVAGGVGEVRNKEQARYEELEIAAKRLAIPVLNANRFLSMVGYYNTTVVRY
jgi:hypothetical protein